MGTKWFRVKCETYQVAPGKDSHGYSGPLKVSYGSYFTNIGRQFLEVAPKYDTSRGTTEDPSNMHADGINKYGVCTDTFFDIKTY